jgi:DNA-binding response OmpR family regulator
MHKALLESNNFKVLTAENGSAGLTIANREPIDVVILDYSMPGMDGGRVATELRRRCPNVAVLLSSGIEEIPKSVLALMDGVVAKGTSFATLIKEIERVTTRRARPPAQSPTIRS